MLDNVYKLNCSFLLIFFAFLFPLRDSYITVLLLLWIVRICMISQ